MLAITQKDRPESLDPRIIEALETSDIDHTTAKLVEEDLQEEGHAIPSFYVVHTPDQRVTLWDYRNNGYIAVFYEQPLSEVL